MNKARMTLSVLAVLGLIAVSLYNGCQSVPPEGEPRVASSTDSADGLVIMTWNVRGYPEKRAADRAWFSDTLSELAPDVVCVQEIANQGRVDTFIFTETAYSSSAFQDSSDGQDNAIFADASVTMQDIDDPTGFQHPVQAAYVAHDGFDAVIVTVHLSWTNTALREQEKRALASVVTEMLAIDPDLIINGDFNTTEDGIQELAEAIGMVVMIPAGQDGVGTTHADNRYDHFLVSPDLATEEAISCRIQTFEAADLEAAKRVSDHLPVLAVFATDDRFKDRD